MSRNGLAVVSAFAFGVSAACLGYPGCAAVDEGAALAEAEGEDPDRAVGAPGKADGPVGDWPATGPLPAVCDLDRPLQAFFAPDDPTVTLELRLIDRVRAAARDAGGRAAAKPEGENPHRIRYAVYNLLHDAIVRSLADAEADGVDVQVLIESDQLSTEWNRTDDLFRERGLEVALDHHALDDAGRRTADLVGISDPGLMHLKTRLFETPGWSALLTGSMNPNQAAGANEETLHLVRDIGLIARYAETYDAVLAGRGIANRWDDAAAVNVLFTPAASGERAATRILRWIEEEDEQVLLMVFSLRDVSSPGFHESLSRVLARKVAAGVPVLAITDRKQSDGVDLAGAEVFKDDPTEDRLRAAGVPVWEVMNDARRFFPDPYAYAAMHHKVAILGRTHVRVITDAANWTGAALGTYKYPEKNVESVLFIDTERLDHGYTGRRYLAQWLRVLSRYADQGAPDGEDGFAAVAAAIQGAAGWPSQAVSFRADPATAVPGEQVFAVGDLDALGRWGEAGPGVPLLTTPDDYPVWTSAASVPLPLGSPFAWKLVKRHGDAVTWEAGGDRPGFATPAACAGPVETAEHAGAWR